MSQQNQLDKISFLYQYTIKQIGEPKALHLISSLGLNDVEKIKNTSKEELIRMMDHIIKFRNLGNKKRKVKHICKSRLPDGLPLQQLHNFAMVNNLTIEFKYVKGILESWVKIAEIEYDLDVYNKEVKKKQENKNGKNSN